MYHLPFHFEQIIPQAITTLARFHTTYSFVQIKKKKKAPKIGMSLPQQQQKESVMSP
jgi:hypothetical protein